MLVWLLWLLVGIFAIVLDFFLLRTKNLVPFSFGAAAVAVSITTVVTSAIDLKVHFLIQLALFIGYALVVFLFVRPAVAMLFPKAFAQMATNIYGLIGKFGVVLEDVSYDSPGQVKVGGEQWSAISSGREPIPIGAKVEVVNSEGNKLIVKRASARAD